MAEQKEECHKELSVKVEEGPEGAGRGAGLVFRVWVANGVRRCFSLRWNPRRLSTKYHSDLREIRL